MSQSRTLASNVAGSVPRQQTSAESSNPDLVAANAPRAVNPQLPDRERHHPPRRRTVVAQRPPVLGPQRASYLVALILEKLVHCHWAARSSRILQPFFGGLPSQIAGRAEGRADNERIRPWKRHL